ncbi:MAG TPA: DNA double-strand break repair nuclease NurA [Anaerolineales bacterium]
MALDFQQVRQQVHELGENALARQQQIKTLRSKASSLLESYSEDLDRLRQKVQTVVHSYDPSLRCALPGSEPLNAHYPLPALPSQVTLLAADGSQINPDRHAAVNYCLINLGAIQMCSNSSEPPTISSQCKLFYDNELYTPTGTLTEDMLALRRDLTERSLLATLVAEVGPPVITFTDGPIELWGAKDSGGEDSEFQKSLEAYQDALNELCSLGAATAGYVDKPGANLVVRLLEVAVTPQDELPGIRKAHPLRGVIELDLYRDLLAPGERSAVFAMQSQSAKLYEGNLGLHFFYLNVGRAGHPWLSRVEVPAWVAGNPEMLDHVHASLVHQCSILGSRPYPYLLHRAHEAAVVSQEEKEQVTQMIMMELRRRGVLVGEESYKQAAKSLGGRTRYGR